MRVRSSRKGYPPSWEVMDEFGAKITSGRYSGFKDTPSVRRFGARYRAANLYNEVRFDDMTDATASGYCGFSRILFTYSAFEFLLRSINIKQSKCQPLFCSYDMPAWAQEIKKIDRDIKLHRHLLEFCNQTHKNNLKKFMRGEDFNYSYLASSIRHAFAHGMLTPNGGGCNAVEVGEICQNISEKLIIVMDDIFSDKMEGLINA